MLLLLKLNSDTDAVVIATMTCAVRGWRLVAAVECSISFVFVCLLSSVDVVTHAQSAVEHSDSEKIFRFDFPKRIDFFDSVHTSLEYRLLSFTMLSNVNSTPSSWVTLTTSQRRRLSRANAAAESNGRFFNKTNRRIDSNRNALVCSRSGVWVPTASIVHDDFVSFATRYCLYKP